MNPQAEELNDSIKRNNPALLDMLSDKGKEIFFPKKGIVSQSAEAAKTEINATIGIALEEDGSPMRLKSIASCIKGINPKDIFAYAPSFGRHDLRNKWKELIFEKNPSLNGKEISVPIVTSALTNGLSIAGYMLVNPGDTIVSPDLFWGNYNMVFANAYGAKIETFTTFINEKFNIDGLKEKLFQGTGKKIILLNFPNNPTGYTPTEDEAKQIIFAIKEAAEAGNNIVAIIDDAYFGLVYQNEVYKESIFSELSGISENVLAVKIDGATKEDYAWGLRVGFITYGIKGGNNEIYVALENKTAGAIRGNVSNCSNLSQSLVLMALNSPKYAAEKKKKFNILRKRFKSVQKIFREHKEYSDFFEALPFNSGYFMCVRLKDGLDSEKIRQSLLQKYNTGVISMGNVIRLAFSAVQTEKIPKLFENLHNACKEF